MAQLGVCLDTAELTRTQNIAWVGKGCGDANGASLRVNLPVYYLILTFDRVGVTVRKRQRQRHRRRIL